MRHNVSVEELISYLKKWCIKPAAEPQEQRPAEDELEGADFTSTVEHVQQVYSYLYMNCSQGRLKELFQHNPAVFIEYNRQVVRPRRLAPAALSLAAWLQVKLSPALLQTGRELVFGPFLPPEGGVLG